MWIATVFWKKQAKYLRHMRLRSYADQSAIAGDDTNDRGTADDQDGIDLLV